MECSNCLITACSTCQLFNLSDAVALSRQAFKSGSFASTLVLTATMMHCHEFWCTVLEPTLDTIVKVRGLMYPFIDSSLALGNIAIYNTDAFHSPQVLSIPPTKPYIPSTGRRTGNPPPPPPGGHHPSVYAKWVTCCVYCYPHHMKPSCFYLTVLFMKPSFRYRFIPQPSVSGH